MADEAKKLQVSIEATSNLAKVAGDDRAAVEGLTNTGKGLATGQKELEQGSKAFVIATDAEYLAIRKAADALRDRIAVVAAAGGSTMEMEEKLAALNETLSTEQALYVAERVEKNAAARASLEMAEAVKGEAAAHGMNAVAMRESAVIMRELAAGRTTRLIGSISILAGQFGSLASYVIPATFALFGVSEVLKMIAKDADDLADKTGPVDFLSNLEARASVLAEAAGAAQSYADKLAQIATGEQSVSEQLRNQLGLDKAIEVARASLTNAQKGLELAQLQAMEGAGKLSPEQAAEKRAEIEKKYIVLAQQQREEAQQKEMQDQQDQLARDEANQRKLEQQTEQADEALKRDKEHRTVVKASLPELNKEAAEAQGKIDQAQDFLSNYKEQFPEADPQKSEYVQAQQRIVDTETARLHQINLRRNQFAAINTPEASGRLADEKAAADLANRLQTENTTQIAELRNSIDQLTRVISAARPIERQTADVKSQAVDATEQARIIKEFEEGASKLVQFDKTTSLNPDLIREASRTVADMHDALSQHAELLRQIVGLKQDIQALQQAQAILASQSQHAGQNTLSF